MFIDPTHNVRTCSVRRSGTQLELNHLESFRSSERSRGNSRCSIYKHVTLNRVKRGSAELEFKLEGFAGEWLADLGGDRVRLPNL